MKLRVLFEISELGSLSGTGERGVRRVVQNLAEGLFREPGIDTRFTGLALADREGLAKALSEAALDSTSFASTPAWIHRLARLSGQTNARGLSRSLRQAPIIRGALYRFARGVAASARHISARDWNGVDVFHSPFPPLPRRERMPAGVAAFLTIYDLIPLLHPQLVGSGSIEQVKAITGSIHPGAWLTCISRAVKQDVIQVLKFPPERIFVTHLAASREIFHPATEADTKEVRDRYGIGGFPYILSLSEIERRKNIGHLLASFELMLRDHPDKDLRLVLVGRYAPQSPEFRALRAAHPAVAGRIIFTGFIPNEDLAAIYSGALAFAFPSLAEGFGLPPLEAMQCGVPVISSNTTSLPEVVGDAGILLDPTNQEAWADAIYKLVSSDELRQKLSAQSLARAQHFTWEKTIKTLVSAYEYALAHKS